MFGLAAAYSCSTKGCIGRDGITQKVFADLQVLLNGYADTLQMLPLPVNGVITEATALELAHVAEHYPQLGLAGPFTAVAVAKNAAKILNALGSMRQASPATQTHAQVLLPSLNPPTPPDTAPLTVVNQPRNGLPSNPGPPAPPNVVNQPRTNFPVAPTAPSTAPATTPDASVPTTPGPTVVVQDSSGGSTTSSPLAPIDTAPAELAPVSVYDDAAMVQKLKIGALVVAAIGAVATATGFLLVRRRRRLAARVAP